MRGKDRARKIFQKTIGYCFYTPLLLVLFTTVFLIQPAFAHDEENIRAKPNHLLSALKPEELKRQVRLRFAPVDLHDGGSLTLVSPEEWAPLAEKVSAELLKIHRYFAELFGGSLPAFTTTLRLMDEQSFYELTGAPRWTNAMFYRGQIIIPLDGDLDKREMDNLSRSLRHEYTHAVIHALSKGRCPGWLDEGIAQWVEGEENPVLVPALRSWLSKKKRPVQLAHMQGGFTVLESEMVPVAYAQSLFMSQDLISTYGFLGIRRYLDALAKGKTDQQSFQEAFLINTKDYEAKSEKLLQRWKNSSSPRILYLAKLH